MANVVIEGKQGENFGLGDEDIVKNEEEIEDVDQGPETMEEVVANEISERTAE